MGSLNQPKYEKQMENCCCLKVYGKHKPAKIRKKHWEINVFRRFGECLNQLQYEKQMEINVLEGVWYA